MAQWWRWWSLWFSLCFGDDDDTLQHLAVRSQYRDQALGGWAPSGICRHFSKVETRFTCGPLVIFVITRKAWKLSERHTLEQWAKHLYHNWKQNNFMLPLNLLQRIQAKISGMWQRIDSSQKLVLTIWELVVAVAVSTLKKLLRPAMGDVIVAQRLVSPVRPHIRPRFPKLLFIIARTTYHWPTTVNTMSIYETAPSANL